MIIADLINKQRNPSIKSIFDGTIDVNNPINATINKSSIERRQFKWSIWANSLSGQELVNFVRDEVFPFFTNVSKNNENAILENSRLQIDEPIVLKQILNLINEIKLHESDEDTNGDLFEYVLKGIQGQGELGQYRTPRHIIDFIVSVIKPVISEQIYDPAVGTAGFLVSAFNYIKLQHTSTRMIKEITVDGIKKKVGIGDKLSDEHFDILDKKTFYGNDASNRFVRLSLMNLYLRGLTSAKIFKRNSLSDTFDKNYRISKKLPIDGYDIILANPPFSGSIDKARINEDVKVGNTSSTQLLFLKHIYKHLNSKGRCGVIVPDGTLSNPSKADIEIRRLLVENTSIKSVISLPAGVFEPYTKFKTSILFFAKGDTTEKILFFRIDNDGYLLDANHNVPIELNDLPEAFNAINNSKELYKDWLNRGEVWENKFCFATKEEIIKDNYNLSILNYMPMRKLEENYDNPTEILNEIDELEKEIGQRIQSLKDLI